MIGPKRYSLPNLSWSRNEFFHGYRGCGRGDGPILVYGDLGPMNHPIDGAKAGRTHARKIRLGRKRKRHTQAHQWLIQFGGVLQLECWKVQFDNSVLSTT